MSCFGRRHPLRSTAVLALFLPGTRARVCWAGTEHFRVEVCRGISRTRAMLGTVSTAVCFAVASLFDGCFENRVGFFSGEPCWCCRCFYCCSPFFVWLARAPAVLGVALSTPPQKANNVLAVYPVAPVTGFLTPHKLHPLFYPPPPQDYDGQPLRHAEQKDVNEFCTHLLHKLEGSSREAGSLIDRVFGGTLVYQIISRCARD